MLALREHQQDVVDKLSEGFNSGHRCQILYAPTGMGKTEVAISIMKSYAEQFKKVAMVMDRIVLVEQTSLRLGKYNIPHGVMQATHWRNRPYERIQICSAQTLEARNITPDMELLIIDECHVLRAGILEIIENNPNLKVIGLTATPFANGMGRVYSHVVNAPTTKELIDKEWLCPLKVFIAKEIDMTGVSKQMGEWAQSDVTNRGMQITGDIVAEWHKKTYEVFGKPMKTIVFCAGVAHGRDLEKKFKEAGFNFVSISYKEDDDYKREAIEEFSKPDSTIQGLIATDILTRGFDVSDVMIGVSARPFSKSLSSHVQQLGRVMRPHEGKEFALWLDHCIASGQKVLTHRGLVPIEKILISDTIWDGHEFVTHKGVVSRGKRPVITYAGLTATPDHLVKTRDEGWCSLGYCAEKQKTIITTGIGGENIRECDDYFTGRYLARAKKQKIYACSMRMRNVRLSFYYFIDKFRGWKNKGLQTLQSTKASAKMAQCTNISHDAKMQQPEECAIRKLWWKGNRVQIRLSDFLRSLDSNELGMLARKQGNGVRPNKQQWELRGGEYSLGQQKDEYKQSQNIQMDSFNAQIQINASKYKLCRYILAFFTKCWTYIRPNSGKILQAISETEREVWDIVDCGPRNSFTCEGLLVHNSGNYLRFRDDWDDLYEYGVKELKEGKETTKAEPTEKEKRDSKCPACGGLWTSPTNICDECGFEKQIQKNIISVAGELRELDAKKRQKELDGARFYGEVLHYAREKGYKEGWAAFKYKEKIGVFPPREWSSSKGIPPSPETLGWIKSRTIAYAKGKAKWNS